MTNSAEVRSPRRLTSWLVSPPKSHALQFRLFDFRNHHVFTSCCLVQTPSKEVDARLELSLPQFRAEIGRYSLAPVAKMTWKASTRQGSGRNPRRLTIIADPLVSCGFFSPFFFFFSFNPIPSTLGAGALCRQTGVRNTQPENAPEPARHLGVRRCSASTLAVIMWLPDGRKTNRKPQTKTPHSSRRCKPCTTVRARYRPASLEAHAPIMMVTSKLLVDIGQENSESVVVNVINP